MNTGFLRTLHDESNPDTSWIGLEFSINNGDKKERIIKFDSGDPIIDFYNYKKWLSKNGVDIIYISHSSTIDHFFMDSKKYLERHVIFNEDYSDGQLMYWQDAEKLGYNSDGLITVCVTKDIKTWKQLKNYVKSKIK